MKKYAAKSLEDGSIKVITCKGDPEQFLQENDELIGELPKDAQGAYITPDRQFRSSWRDNAGSVEVDLPLARAGEMEKLRKDRDEKLLETDAKYMEVLSKGGDDTAIKALKDTLRDLPANTDMSAMDEAALKTAAGDALAALDMSALA